MIKKQNCYVMSIIDYHQRPPAQPTDAAFFAASLRAAKIHLSLPTLPQVGPLLVLIQLLHHHAKQPPY